MKKVIISMMIVLGLFSFIVIPLDGSIAITTNSHGMEH